MRKIAALTIIACFLLSACSTKEVPPEPIVPEPPEETSKKEEQQPPVNGEKREDDEKEITPLFEFTSPDNKSIIIMTINSAEIAEGIPYEFAIYHNNKKNNELTVWDVTKDPVVWLDNETAIIGGQYLYDLEKNTAQYLWPDEGYIFTYSFSPDKNFLAICRKTQYQGRDDVLGFNIQVINLKNFEVKDIYTFPGSSMWTSGTLFRISWLDESTFFFDGNNDEKPTIFKVSLEENEVSTFISGAWGPGVSPEGNFIAFSPLTDFNYQERGFHLVIQDLALKKKVILDNYTSVVWLDEKTFLTTSFDEPTEVYQINNDLSYSLVDVLEKNIMEVVLINPSDFGYQVGYLFWDGGEIKSKVTDIKINTEKG